ncbi:hypothetical protein ACFL5U_03470 [Candidatus Margulisiibacteriota bacterium]
MSLYFVFTIDGDWDEYFCHELPEQKRKPEKRLLLTLINRELETASLVNGKVIHFVHTSPLARDFFLQPEFIAKWQEMKKKGGDVGVHCHEEELYKAWHFDDQEKMQTSVSFLTKELNKAGLNPIAYRGGFMTFSPKLIPILEQNGLFLDFSCESGRHLEYNNVLVSDWQGAPTNFYRLDYNDHRKVGQSKVFEVPLGIYIERQSLWQIWQKARELKKKNEVTVVSVMAHTYDFTSFKMRLKIKLALLILKISCQYTPEPCF